MATSMSKREMNTTSQHSIQRTTQQSYTQHQNEYKTDNWIGMFGDDSFADNLAPDGFNPKDLEEALFPSLNLTTNTTLVTKSKKALSKQVESHVDRVLVMVNYKDDAMITESILPLHIRMLYNESFEQNKIAIKNLIELSKKDGPAHALLQCEELIPALMFVLKRSSSSLSIKYEILTIIKIFSDCVIGRTRLFRSQSLTFILNCLPVELLSSGEYVVSAHFDERVAKRALSTIHKLLIHSGEDVVAPLRIGNAVYIMTALLNTTGNDRFKAVILNCLIILCGNDNSSKIVFVENNGLIFLYAIMQRNLAQKESVLYEKLAIVSMKLFCVLSAFNGIKEEMIAKGGIARAIEMVHISKVRTLTFIALRNLSDKHRPEGDFTLVDLAIDTINGSIDDAILECCAGILCNVTCNNGKHKLHTIDENGIPLVISKFMSTSKIAIKTSLLGVLRNITCTIIGTKDTAKSARNEVGSPVMIQKLTKDLKRNLSINFVKFSDENRQIISNETAIIGLLRNLALNKGCRQEMLENHTVAAIVDILRKINGLSDGFAENLRFNLNALIERSLGCLHTLMMDSSIRGQIRGSTAGFEAFILLISQYFTEEDVTFQREACGIFAELTKDADSDQKAVIMKYESKMESLAQSSCRAVSIYSSFTLFKASGEAQACHYQQQYEDNMKGQTIIDQSQFSKNQEQLKDEDQCQHN